MNETHVTLSGNVGSDVTIRRAGDAEVASFRLACTPRRRHRRSDEWFDAPTQWWTVSAWRLLGRNCAQSLRRGDPVVVHGRVDARTWTNQSGVEVTTMEVEAVFVGHDLNRGTASFARAAARPTLASPAEDEPVGDLPTGDLATEAAGQMAQSAPDQRDAQPGRGDHDEVAA